MLVGLPSWAGLLLILSTGFAHNLPPLPEDTTLTSAAPDNCLFFLSSYGIAEAKPQSANRTERLLAEPEVQRMIRGVWAALKSRVVLKSDASERKTFEDLVFPVVETVVRRPLIFFVEDVQTDASRPLMDAAMVINLGERREQLKPLLVRWEQEVIGVQKGDVTQEDVDGVNVRYVSISSKQSVGWGLYEDYLFIVVGERMAEQVIGKLKAARGPPEWLRECMNQNPIQRPATVQWINLRKILERISAEIPEEAAAVLDTLGLTRLQTMTSVAGLDGEGTLACTSIELTPGPGGIFSLLPDQPLAAEHLVHVPADSTLALAFRLDAAEMYRRFFALVRSVHPVAENILLQALADVESELGFEVQADLLQPLGDIWTLHSSSSEGGLLSSAATAQVRLRDPDRFAATLDKLLKRIAQENGVEGDAFKQMQASGTTITCVNQEQLNWPVIPAWCLVDDTFIVSISPQTLRAHLALRASRAKAGEAAGLASNAAVAAALEQQPVKLFYVNTGEMLQVTYPVLQLFAPLICAELRRDGIDIDPAILPAITALRPHAMPSITQVQVRPQSIRWEMRQSIPGTAMAGAVSLGAALVLPMAATDMPAASHRVSNAAPGTAELKQIADAMHAYAAGQGRFPAPASFSREGKPLLSWRVHLLPYLDQQELYEQFHLDEPWDSEHNKKLIAKMPDVFAPAATVEQRAQGKTRVLLPVGERTMFPLDKRGLGVGVKDVTDGLKNTVMIIQVDDDRAVPWTSPQDHEFDPDNPTAGLFRMADRLVTVVLGDGSVWNIMHGADHDYIKALFTRDGNEPETVAPGAGVVPVRRGRD